MYLDERTTARTVLVDGVRLSTGTLTAVPVPAPSSVDVRVGRMAMLIAPVAVLPLGLTVGAICWLGMAIGLPPPVVATVAVGALVLGNRCFHVDGLADSADGLAASYERDRALEIMHRGDTGPAGVAATVLVLALQVTALATVVVRPYGWLLAAVAVCCSRGILSLACHRRVPAARRSGLASTVAATVPTLPALLVGFTATASVAAGICATGQPWWQGVCAVAAAGSCVAVFVRRCVQRLGGITGDVLGACIELALAVILVASAAG